MQRNAHKQASAHSGTLYLMACGFINCKCVRYFAAAACPTIKNCGAADRWRKSSNVVQMNEGRSISAVDDSIYHGEQEFGTYKYGAGLLKRIWH